MDRVITPTFQIFIAFGLLGLREFGGFGGLDRISRKAAPEEAAMSELEISTPRLPLMRRAFIRTNPDSMSVLACLRPLNFRLTSSES